MKAVKGKPLLLYITLTLRGPAFFWYLKAFGCLASASRVLGVQKVSVRGYIGFSLFC